VIVNRLTDKQGIQLCATVRKFDALEKLNDGKRIDGLVLIVAITPEGLELSLDMPKTFAVRRFKGASGP
jgi:hypothetical protein